MTERAKDDMSTDPVAASAGETPRSRWKTSDSDSAAARGSSAGGGASGRSATGAPPASPSPPKPPARPAKDDEDDGETVLVKSKAEDPEMDVTPMVDVVFQLLIFFMITASFSLQKSKEFPKPQEDKPSANVVPKDVENDADFVIVYVTAQNTFRVETPDWEEEAPSEQDLLLKLKRARAGDGSGKVPTRLVVKASGESMHEIVIVALDAGTSVGMEQIQLQTVENDDE